MNKHIQMLDTILKYVYDTCRDYTLVELKEKTGLNFSTLNLIRANHMNNLRISTITRYLNVDERHSDYLKEYLYLLEVFKNRALKSDTSESSRQLLHVTSSQLHDIKNKVKKNDVGNIKMLTFKKYLKNS